ncbi:MAG: hypothetical protein GXO54_00440, partial [Chloroflexi bacterium]|nr:hypothetical protein [Chloroflexota bacterium]
SDAGKPVVVTQPESPVAKALRAVAEQVAAQVSVQALKGKGPVVPIEIIEEKK